MTPSRIRRLTAAALALATVLVAAPSASAVNAPPLRGVTISPVYSDTPVSRIQGALDQARAARAGVVRIVFLWNALEPDRQGQFNAAYVAKLDAVVAAAQARGIKLLPVVYSTPCWASSAPANLKGNCAPAPDSAATASYPPANPADFAPAAAFVAQRFRGKLAGFEVWLEPDHIGQYYWAGPDKPARYAALVRAVYRPIKAADPSLPVLAGSLVGTNGNFLRALYANGMRGFYDGLAVHHYDLILNSLRAIRRVQTANRDSAPLWLTEVGWASCAGRGRRFERGLVCITERAHALKLGDIFGALRRPSFVRAAIVYDLEDAPNSTMGLLRADRRTRKPAFAPAILAFSGRIGGPRRPTLTLRRRRGAVTASGGGPTGDYFVLKAFRAGSRRAAFQATIRPNKDDRFSLRLPRALSSGRWLVQVQQPWTGLRAQKRL